MADTCYEAELALSMAAWNCDVDTVEILLKHGASVEAVNNKGDNVFHSLIQVGLTPQTNLCCLQLSPSHPPFDGVS